MFNRRERWGLSLRGVFLLVAVTGGGLLLIFSTIYPFLAVSHPLDTGILVVEGWIPPFAIRAAADEIRSHPYATVYTTGGPMGRGTQFDDANLNTAELAYSRLIATGVSSNLVQQVSTKVFRRYLTFTAVLALRFFAAKRGRTPAQVNVITVAAHARRSRLLFQKALGPRTQVGIISIPAPDFPANHWWRYSEGVKEVLSEGAAYLYVRLFFWP